MGALLRREGIYTYHLATWRRERERGLTQLERENARLQAQLGKAERILEAPKKLLQALDLPEPTRAETNETL